MMDTKFRYEIERKTEYDSENNLDSIYWKLHNKRDIPLNIKTTIGSKSSSIEYEYHKKGFIEKNNKSPSDFEISILKIIFGNIDNKNWDRSFGISFLDINNTGNVDLIELGGYFYDIGYFYSPRYPHCKFYKGSLYLEKLAEINNFAKNYFKSNKPGNEEAGYWKDSYTPKLIPSDSDDVYNLFSLSEFFYRDLRNKIRINSKDLEKISEIEEDAKLLINKILDQNVVELYKEHTK